jgi:hypothetical protein
VARHLSQQRAQQSLKGATNMLVTTALWIAAAGIVAVSFESIGAALVLFGIAGLLIRLA